MTTISIPTGISGRAAQFSSRLCAETSLAPTGRIPEWLPVPAAAPVRPAGSSRQRARGSQRARSWISPEGAPLSERVMLLMLGLAGAAGIGYGFSCLLDLVQHWAMFGAGVNQLVQ